MRRRSTESSFGSPHVTPFHPCQLPDASLSGCRPALPFELPPKRAPSGRRVLLISAIDRLSRAPCEHIDSRASGLRRPSDTAANPSTRHSYALRSLFWCRRPVHHKGGAEPQVAGWLVTISQAAIGNDRSVERQFVPCQHEVACRCLSLMPPVTTSLPPSRVFACRSEPAQIRFNQEPRPADPEHLPSPRTLEPPTLLARGTRFEVCATPGASTRTHNDIASRRSEPSLDPLT